MSKGQRAGNEPIGIDVVPKKNLKKMKLFHHL